LVSLSCPSPTQKLLKISAPDYKLRDLWDKIEKAKRGVETILIPMRFTGESSYARYSKKMERSAYLSVKATIKPEEDDASGGIVYIGPSGDNARAKRQVGVRCVFNAFL
jgi:hypothetical protein